MPLPDYFENGSWNTSVEIAFMPTIQREVILHIAYPLEQNLRNSLKVGCVQFVGQKKNDSKGYDYDYDQTQ